MSSFSTLATKVIRYPISLFHGFINALNSGYYSFIQHLLNLSSSFSFSTSGITSTITTWLNYVNIHYNFLLLDLIPSSTIQYVAPASLLTAGHVSEKRYVGRATVFTNTVALNVFIYYFLQNKYLFLSSVYTVT